LSKKILVCLAFNSKFKLKFNYLTIPAEVEVRSWSRSWALLYW